MVLLQSALAEQPPLLISQALIAVEVRDDTEQRMVGRGEKTTDALLLVIEKWKCFRTADIGSNMDNSKGCKASNTFTGEVYQTLIPNFHKLFQKLEEKGRLPNSFL